MPVARDRRRTVPRPVKSGRPSEAEIRKASGEASLANALLAYFGHRYEPITKLYDDGSVNKIACRLAVMAHDTPELGARATVRELTERHKWFRDDEGPTSNVYDSETVFGRLFDLQGLTRYADDVEDRNTPEVALDAIEELRRDLSRTQALYALLATPGVVRGLNGQKVYEGPVVRAAGMRSLASRVANPSTTPVASALLGGGTWHREPGPLERALKELAVEMMPGGGASWWWGTDPLDSAAKIQSVMRWAQRALAGTRTKHEYLIQRYANGSVFSALLGPIGASSTAQIRGAYVFGPEAKDCETCHPFGAKERKVAPSHARIEGGVLETWVQDSNTRWSKALPAAEPVLVVRLGPAEPEFLSAPPSDGQRRQP